MTQPSPWIKRWKPRPAAKARLFCFHHAGAGATAYRLWPDGLPAEFDVCAIHLPGRELRFSEPLLSDVAEIVRGIVAAIEPQLDLPFAFFGHSMGAVLAFEVAHALQERGVGQPHRLFVSGRRPPHWPSGEAPMHGLDDAAFIAEINRRYGGIPAEFAQHQELLEVIVSSLRADITALETHRPPASWVPLACPISAFGGDTDPLTPHSHLEAWRSETTGAFDVRLFPGDHFYLNADRKALLDDIGVKLAPLLASADRPIG